MAGCAQDGTLRLDTFLPYRLSYTSNRVSARIATAYSARFGLSIPEWRVIAVVAEQDGITQQAIGERTQMDKMTVSRAAVALSARGLLERRPNDADRRSLLLRLSEAGRALYAEIAPLALALEAELFEGFSQEELDRFVTLLRRIDRATAAGRG